MFQEILTHLNQNKLRTALTGLSVSVGIFLLIFLLGAGNGLIHAFQANGSNFATDVVEVFPGYTSKPYDGLAKDRSVKLDDRDVRLTRTALPGNIIEATAKISLKQTMRIISGEHQVSSWFEGVYPLAVEMGHVKMLAGRFINDLDMKQCRKVVVITNKVAEDFFGSSEAAIDKMVRVDSLSYRIIGVRSNKGDWGQARSYIPFTTLRTAYNTGINIDELNLRTTGVATDSAAAQFSRDIRRSISRRHRFSPTDENALWINNTAQGAKEQDTTIGILRNALWIIGLLTLLSGVVSISNIMLITVKERTHEFGIRKALGARPWSILRSVMLESVIITILSGYIGLVAGIAATEWMDRKSGEQVMEIMDQKFYTFLDPTIDLRIAISALTVLIIAGLVAGFFPARKAVRVKPIEALNAK